MKRKQPVANIVLIALTVLAGLALVILWPLPSGAREVIVLPDIGEQTEPPIDIGEQNRFAVSAVEVTRDNVLRVLATLSRPTEYATTARLTYAYPDGGGEAVSRIFRVATAVKGHLARAELTDLSGSMPEVRKNTLIDGETAFVWETSLDTLSEGKLGDFTVDDLAHMPTYETLIGRDPAGITAGRIDSESDSVVVESRHPFSGYQETWVINIANGLLWQYYAQDAGHVVYSAEVEVAQIGEGATTQADFTLPDGRVIE